MTLLSSPTVSANEQKNERANESPEQMARQLIKAIILFDMKGANVALKENPLIKGKDHEGDLVRLYGQVHPGSGSKTICYGIKDRHAYKNKHSTYVLLQNVLGQIAHFEKKEVSGNAILSLGRDRDIMLSVSNDGDFYISKE